MPSPLKRLIKNTLHKFGVDVFYYVPNPPHAVPTLLSLYRVDTVFDIGANIGMSGQYFRNLGFKHKIVSFEPVSRFYRQLEQVSAPDPLWFCEHAAVGDSDTEMEINVSGSGGGASSFLEMTDNIRDNAPDLMYVGIEKVKVVTIDSVIDRYYPNGDRLFLKLDVQGYEKNVLEGAKESLNRIVGMRVEFSLVKNYEHEPLVHDMLSYLYELGFRLTGIEPAWSNEATQEVYQVDGILFRPDRL